MSATESTHGRERILQRAEELFLQGGYAAVSIRDIARACGISNAAIYHHFAGKEALFLAILGRISHRHQKILQEAAQGDAWLERLTNMSICRCQSGNSSPATTFSPARWRLLTAARLP